MCEIMCEMFDSYVEHLNGRAHALVKFSSSDLIMASQSEHWGDQIHPRQ